MCPTCTHSKLRLPRAIQYGSIYKIWIGNKPWIIVSDPDLVKVSFGCVTYLVSIDNWIHCSVIVKYLYHLQLISHEKRGQKNVINAAKKTIRYWSDILIAIFSGSFNG